MLHAVLDLQTILVEARDEERNTEAAYAAIVERFGEVRPFINIVDAEARHSRAIERQMERLGIAVPENGWIGKGTAPATLAAACESAIAGEIENIALYDRLLPQIPDVTTRSVLENLRDASRDNHLLPSEDAWRAKVGRPMEVPPHEGLGAVGDMDATGPGRPKR